MRKAAIGISMLLLIALLSSPALAQRPDRQRPDRPGRGSEAPGRQATDRAPLAQRLQQQINEIKSDHQELVNTLRAIHQTAVRENATETAGRIETLIRQREQTYQNALRRLEQQQQRLQRALERGRRGSVQPAGKQAPAFTLQSFDGRTVSLSDYDDKIVVLEWFNFECPFVKYHYTTVKTMTDLANKYKDKGVVWLAVNSTNHTTPAANQQFAGEQKLPFPILDDRSGEVGRKYGAKTTPHMFMIDRGGAIVYEGAIDNAPLGKVQGADKVNYVDKVLSELTSGQHVSVASTQPYGCSVKYREK